MINYEDDITLPAEWEPQWGIQLTWPHGATDWAPYLNDITRTYIDLAKAIAARERLLIVSPEVAYIKDLLAREMPLDNVFFHSCNTNDTWARDHGFITLSDGTLLDFQFNGWGNKFPSNFDNAINRSIARSCPKVCYQSELDFVLEGGSIESDGHGTILTTSACLLAANRNQPLSQQQIEAELKRRLHAKWVLWIDHGLLEGDDTDGHIDTLVRFAPNNTLLYIGSEQADATHRASLEAMKQQLQTLRTPDGKPYRLLALPMVNPIYFNDERLPATYANFLVINSAVLVPTYNQPDNDCHALQIIAEAFPQRELIPIDSSIIIRQHGSIHCCTMQFPRVNNLVHALEEGLQ